LKNIFTVILSQGFSKDSIFRKTLCLKLIKTISEFRLIILAIIFFSPLLWSGGDIKAQAPQKMSYQAVIRNSNNSLIVNTIVGMRVSILQGSEAGPLVYIETHTVAANGNGLVTVQIGNGTMVTGSFSAIDWADGPYFVKTETDPAGGTNYSITATKQLLSVPYALYAETSGNSSAQGAIGATGATGSIGSTGEMVIMVIQEKQVLLEKQELPVKLVLLV